MRENNLQEVVYRYDYPSDNLGIKVTHNFEYDETVEMDEGILLDFDVDNVPVSLEMLDASKRLGLDSESLKNIVCLEVNILVDEKSISLNAVIGVLMDDIEKKQVFKSFTSNHTNIPKISAQLALV